MSPVDPRDEEWLRRRLAAAVPAPPSSAERLTRLRAARRQVRRRRTAGVVLAAAVAIGGVVLAVPAVVGDTGGRGSLPPADRTPTTTPTPGAAVLECPPARVVVAGRGDRGPATLAPGATAARLCGGGRAGSAPAPRDLLTDGLTRLVDSVNAQPTGSEFCRGPFGDRYLLLVAYPDGPARRVVLDFAGCGSMRVGRVNRLHPDEPYETFLGLLGEQRRTATPPAQVPAPVCVPQYRSVSAIADPADMVAARLCVTYDDNGRTTSVAVPDEDLRTIIDAWRSGPRPPTAKGPGCGPTTPTWVLSGVTAWGDPVQVTAECDRATDGGDWVALTEQAQDVIDRLVDRAGVQVDDGADATTAWSLAQAWLTDVNARAAVHDDRTAAEIADVANGLWVRDPWLPEGELDWDLLGAARTEAPGWEQAWRIPARTPEGSALFVVVRDGADRPWRILSLTR